MESVVYLGSVFAIAGMAVGAMYVIVGLLGKRIDEVGKRIDGAVGLLGGRIDRGVGLLGGRIDDVGQRIDDLRINTNTRFDEVDRRLGRLETQNESMLESLGQVRDRVTRLEVSRAG